MKKALASLGIICLLGACSSGSFTKQVKSMQSKDKHLSCRQILLEINEAEFVKKMEINKRSPNLKHVIMPLGYISNYMSTENTIHSADARVAYLERIYEISGCGNTTKHIPANFPQQEQLPMSHSQVQPIYDFNQSQAPSEINTTSYSGEIYYQPTRWQP